MLAAYPRGAQFWNYKHTPEWIYWLTMIPGGIGYGAILTITLVALISAIDPKDMAAATGVSYLFRATGSVLGISLSTSILQNNLKTQLGRKIVGPGAKEIIEAVRTDVGFIKTLPKHLQHSVIEAYASSMHIVFVCTAVAAALALCSLLPIRQHNLPGRLDRK